MVCSLFAVEILMPEQRVRGTVRCSDFQRMRHTDCTLWTPFNKMHILGQMFVSTNYICFTSKEENLCSLIIPLREVNTCGLVGQRNQVILYWKLYHSFFFFQCWRKPLFFSLISCERTILMCSV